MFVIRALALALLGLTLAGAIAGCGTDCAKIRQRFVLESPDSDLQTLVDNCVASHDCLPLCQRVVDISGQFPGTPSIESCVFYPPSATPPGADAGAGGASAGTVDVIYRPASCP
jgi:hypothetical protein